MLFFFHESVIIIFQTKQQSTNNRSKQTKQSNKTECKLCEQLGTKKKTLVSNQNHLIYIPHSKLIKFSIFFMNLPLPEILFLTSQNIKRKICSSIFGWPWTLISFLALHRRYMVELRINLHKTPIIFLVSHLLHDSSSILCQSRRGCWLKHRFRQVFQIRELKVQEKKRWSRLSIPFMQNTHCVSPWWLIPPSHKPFSCGKG